MDCPTNLLDTARSYLLESVVPVAAAIDTDSDVLLRSLNGLGELGLLGLRIPQEWGGLQVSQQIFENFQELLARYSGALAFLQLQHQGAAAMLALSENSSLKQEFLPAMSKGQILVGLGFSQLRRPGDQLVKAFPVEGGFQLEGQVPWVTGWGLFQQFLAGATLPDGQAVFGIVPLVETYQKGGGEVTFDEPMQLAAMTSTNTVTATLSKWFLPQERVLFIKPPGWIHESDKRSVLGPATFLALGCALAGLDILETASETKSLPFIKDAFASLNSEVTNCRTAIGEAQQNSDLELTEKLKLRGWAIDLAVRCAHAAVTVSSGAANQKHHPAQRVYREALLFTVSGQTQAVMEATLQRLTRPQKPRNNLVKTITYSRVVDLSHAIAADIPQWPNDPPVEFETVAEIGKNGYYLRRFSLGEHSATHINAPKSFHTTGIGIDQYPASTLVVPAVVIDISKQAVINPDRVLTVDDILVWEQQHGEIPAGSVVLVYTGWQDKWLDKNAFFNPDVEGKMHFPGIGRDATLFLIKERQIAGVGIDTHGVDSGQDETFATNSLVLEQPRIVLENIANLDKLPAYGTTLIIGILRLKDGSGSPTGVIALVP